MTQTEFIYHDILTQIISGEMPPGHLMQEKKLAEKYNTSKMPVRDALHLLCRQGYLESQPRRGYVVTEMTRRDFEELLQARNPLELLALDLALERATDEELQQLLELADQADPDKDVTYHSNTVWHLRLVELSGNRYLHNMLSGLMTEIARAGCRFCVRNVNAERKAHRAIAAAMLERNRTKARRLMLKDMHGEY